MRVIGLDLGTKCGWAYTDTSEVQPLNSGTWDFSTKRTDGGGMRYLKFRQHLGFLLRTDGLAVEPGSVVVYFEEVRRHVGTTAAHVYGGFMAVLMELCERSEIPYESVPVGTIKKRATGMGNASKDNMVQAARTQWTIDGPLELIDDDNQADALWCLQCGLDQLGI